MERCQIAYLPPGCYCHFKSFTCVFTMACLTLILNSHERTSTEYKYLYLYLHTYIVYKSIHDYTRKLFFSPFEKLIHSKGYESWMTHQGYLLRSLFSAALRRDATQTLWPHQLTTLYPIQRGTACQSPTS